MRSAPYLEVHMHFSSQRSFNQTSTVKLGLDYLSLFSIFSSQTLKAQLSKVWLDDNELVQGARI